MKYLRRFILGVLIGIALFVGALIGLDLLFIAAEAEQRFRP
jgi:hypothetical protein